MPSQAPRLRFTLQECAGAFGDIGTDLPLIMALIATCGLDATSVCVMFGLAQIATGLRYGIPMPVQPLKVMAALMLSRKYAPEVLAGGGLAIGATMLGLAAAGALGRLAHLMPQVSVRGIQLGLGLTLAKLAVLTYIAPAGLAGWTLAAASALCLALLRAPSRVPGPLVVVLLGGVFAVISGQTSLHNIAPSLHLPKLQAPSPGAIWQGAMLLALPQLPLSLANSVIATSRTCADLFPQRAVSVRAIGLTYGVMNLIVPWWGGMPVCHGCGGLAGFYGFGARTGGAPVIYGALFLCVGLFFADAFDAVAGLFPLPILGIVLLFEGAGLMRLARHGVPWREAWIPWVVAAAVLWAPQGWLVGLALGWGLHLAVKRASPPPPAPTAETQSETPPATADRAPPADS